MVGDVIVLAGKPRSDAERQRRLMDVAHLTTAVLFIDGHDGPLRNRLLSSVQSRNETKIFFLATLNKLPICYHTATGTGQTIFIGA